jgi:trans-2-enoyl-CoA reductase
MGWKSTIAFTRSHAISLIMERAMKASNQELEELLELVGYGDDTNLSLFGFNFTVLDTNEDVDRWNRDDYES